MNVYGGLLRLYPRGFREEYAEDMTQLLRNQLRDENAARVWARTLLDLTLTAPTLRLEAHMSAPTSAPVVYGAAAVGSLALAALAGTAIGVSAIGVTGVLLFGVLAAISWRRSRALGDTGHASAHWWKYLAGGIAGLTGTVVLANLGGDDLSESMWAVFAGTLLTSVALTAVGVVLGITSAVSRSTA